MNTIFHKALTNLLLIGVGMTAWAQVASGQDFLSGLVYDSTRTYSQGDSVILSLDASDTIYTARKEVPVNTPPGDENTEYWATSAEYSNDLATQNSGSLSDVPGDSIVDTEEVSNLGSNTESASSYSFGPQAILSLSGEGNTSKAQAFTVIEPITGLSTTQTTNTDIFVGFVGSLDSGSGLESINPLEIEENQPGGVTVGEFNSTQLEGESITYQLIDGYGDGNNSLFSLDANGTLRTVGPLDYELGTSLSIRIEAKNENNETREQNFTIEVLDDFEPEQPTYAVGSAADLELIWVEPGTFTMGSPETEVGRVENEIERNITLTRGFYLGKYEVTQAEYEAVMAGNNELDSDGNLFSANPSIYSGYPNRPVEGLSYDGLQVFLTRLNLQEADNLPAGWVYVLPTEAQWEYACRAGTTTAYSFGDEINASYANYEINGAGTGLAETTRVGQYLPNPWGFYDMHGNVWEFIEDVNRPYDAGNQIDPENPASSSDTSFLIRGGSWAFGGSYLRSARRGANDGNGSAGLGFRLALRYTNKAPIDLNSTDVLAIAENEQPGTWIGEFNATDPEGHAVTYSLSEGVKIVDWDENHSYGQGDVVQYDGVQWKLVTPVVPEHNYSDSDIFSYHLGAVVVEANGSLYQADLNFSAVEEWSRYESYGMDDRVKYLGSLYRSNVNSGNSARTPGVHSYWTLENFGTDGEHWTALDENITVGGSFWEEYVSDYNNSLFTLDENGTLRSAVVFDFENNASTYTILVQAKDELNASTDRNFTVTLENVNERPDGLVAGGDLVLVEGQSIGTEVGAFFANDPEGGQLSFFFDDAPLFEQNKVEFGGASSGGRMKLVDFNQDGWLDVVEGNGWITLSDGNGSFIDPIQLAYSGGAMEVGDFDNDGYLDVFYGRYATTDFVLFGDESYSFERTMEVFSTKKDTSAFAFDYDNDGDLDLAISHTHAEPGRLLTNQGDGNFTVATPSSHSNIQYQVYGSDLNNDGKIELISASRTRGWTAQEDGNLTTLPGSNFHVLANTLVTPTTMVAKFGDLDGDGDTDVIISEGEYRGFYTFFNTDGNGSFGLGEKLGAGITSGSQFDVGDLDNDGDLDICMLGNQEVYIYVNNGEGNFTQAGEPIVLSHGVNINLGDMDNDGDLDLVFNGGGPKYFLKNLSGGISNHLFTMDVNGTLKTGARFDYEDNASAYTIRVQARDEYNATTQLNFSLRLENDPQSVFTVSGGQGDAPYYQFTNGLGETPDFSTLNLIPGEIYEFEAQGVSASHPFMIGVNYGDMNADLVEGGPLLQDGDKITVTIPWDYWGDLSYFCTNHNAMVQQFKIGQPATHIVELNQSVSLDMIWVEPGTFKMGNPGVSDINVTLDYGYYLGKYEVTQAQYEAVMTGNDAELSPNPSKWPDHPDRPVERVSYDNAKVFLQRLNAMQSQNMAGGWSYVLPTEAEWEYACRAGTTTNYSWGDSFLASQANCDSVKTSIVGQYPPNPWGFYNMHGNVFELTANSYGSYSEFAHLYPEGRTPAANRKHVLRGGSYTTEGFYSRSYSRNANYFPSQGTGVIGFRLGFKRILADTAAPEFSLFGENNVTHEAGPAWVETGYEAHDFRDGNITDHVSIDGTVQSSVPGQYTLIYSITDAAGNEANASRTIHVVDTTAPLITVNGDLTITHEAGDAYIDENASWTDAVDGSGVLSAIGQVNVSVPGTYVLTYNYTDDAGNAADEKTRTIEVVDTTKPVISVNGDLTITHEAGDAYIDENASWTDAVDGSGVLSAIGQVNVSVPGTYVLTYNYTDDAGNSADEKTRTIEVVDTTKPVITVNGDLVITHEAGDSYIDENASWTDAVDGSGVLSATGEVNVSVPGTYVLTYNYTDDAGNAADEKNRTIEVVDTTKPVITLNGDVVITHEAGVSYIDENASWTDEVDGSGVLSATGEVNVSVPGTYVLTYNYTDDAGNAADEKNRTIEVVDTTKPVITVNGDLTITHEAGDSYIDENASWTDAVDGSGVLSATGEVNVSVPGTYVLTYNYTDDAGNAADEKNRTIEVVDTTKPVITVNGDLTITHEAGDSYIDENASWTDAVDGSGVLSATGEVNVSVPGTYVLRYNYTDDAGNAADEKNRTIEVVDTTKPVITVNGDLVITHEAGGSYIDENASWIDAVDGSGVLSATGEVNVSVPGTYVLTYNYTDDAGNAADEKNRTIEVVDTTKPVITVNGDLTITHEAGDAYIDENASWTDAVDGSGVLSAIGQVNVSVPGTYVLTYNYTDDAGNAADEKTRTIEVVDTTKPVITVNGDLTITHEAGDSYIDENASWTDAVDGSGVVAGTGTVNVVVPASYMLSYNYTDDAGNAADEKTRTIEVVDTTAPEIVLNGDAVIFHDVGTEYTDPGAIWYDAVDGDGALVASGEVNASKLGVYTLFYTKTDAVGNRSDANRTVEVVNPLPRNLRSDRVLSILENQEVNTFVGTFLAEDPLGDELRFYLRELVGSVDHSYFRLEENGSLYSAVEFDYETNDTSYTLLVEVVDEHDGRIDHNFTVTLENVVEDNDEDGVEDYYDPDDDNDGFSDVDELAYPSDPFDPDSVANVWPTDIDYSFPLFVYQNAPKGRQVGRFAQVDTNGNSQIYQLPLGSANLENERFALSSAGLLTTGEVFAGGSNESKSFIRIGVSSDGGPVAFSIVPVNQVASPEAYLPMNQISFVEKNESSTLLPALTVLENIPVGAVVAKFHGVDGDDTQALSYSLVVGLGDDHNHLFAIDSNGTLTCAGTIDYEEWTELSIRIKVEDPFEGEFEKVFEFEVFDLDENVPVLSLIGNAEMVHGVGKVFSDPGASWVDPQDGSGTVFSDSHMNANELGTYTLSYAFTDLGGNSAIPVQRTVEVVDQTDPVIVLNGQSMILHEAVTTFTDPGASWTDNIDGSGVVYSAQVVDTTKLGTQYLEYNYTDDAGNIAQITRMVVVEDTTRPVLELSGEEEIQLTVWNQYIEPGVSAQDTFDGNLSEEVKVSGHVNTDLPGTYLLTYNVEDSSGNLAIPLLRKIIVSNRKPTNLTLSNAEIEENKPANTFVGRLSTEDPDDPTRNKNYFYSLLENDDTSHASFTVNQKGEIYSSRKLDFEQNSSHWLHVQTRDQFGGIYQKMIEIQVRDAFVPILDTVVRKLNEKVVKMGGQVLATGGEEMPTLTGILVSDQPISLSSLSTDRVSNFMVPMNLSTWAFSKTLRIETLPFVNPEKLYCIAYAENSEGRSFGLEEVMQLEPMEQERDWLTGAEPLGGDKGWWNSPWFGTYYRSEPSGWFLHLGLGWIYPIPSEQGGIWIWKEGMGWLWTSEQVYPFLNSSNTGTWLYFYGEVNKKRLFYDYGLDKWITQNDAQVREEVGAR